MNKNEICDVRIEDMSLNGEGIGKCGGYTLFVKDAVVGDAARVKVTKAKKTYGYARLEELLVPSPFRTEPLCPHHRRCGGCQLQALSYEQQLAFKTDKVKNNLQRIGGLKEVPMQPIIGMETPYRYRNKAQYPVGKDKNGNIVAGFYAGRTHDIIDSEDCCLGAEINGEILRAVKAYMRECHVEPYDEKTGKGLVRHVLIRNGQATEKHGVCGRGETSYTAHSGSIRYEAKQKELCGKEQAGMVSGASYEGHLTENAWQDQTAPDRECGGSRQRELHGKEQAEMVSGASYEGHLTENAWQDQTAPDRDCGGSRHTGMSSGEKLIKAETGDAVEIMVCLIVNGNMLPQQERLIARLRVIPYIVSIMLNVNRERTNVILGAETKILWGKSAISDSIGDLTFSISPQSFFQVNPVQTEKLYGRALEYAGLTSGETVWDLYCGIGSISLFLARGAKQVYGVEIVPQAVEDARQNAAANGIENTTFFVGKAEEIVPQKYAEEGIMADVVVVDPPRRGCEEKLLEAMVKMSPQRIVYVSCDPATLARDVKYLSENGYAVQEVTPVDMFPMTVHVETVVLLSKGEVDSKKIRVEFSLEDMDMSEFQDGATYPQIKEYVLEHTGLKVSSLYISQIKRKCGLDVGQNYNLSKKENAKQPQCPPEKEAAIMEALKYYQMI